jgi:ERCC4-type nuclease
MPRGPQPAIRIVVDVHEAASGSADVLTASCVPTSRSHRCRRATTPSARTTLVERKRVRDLHSAVIKGRLWPQLAKLRAAADFPYLLVEGTDIDRGPLAAAAVRGACLAAIDQGIALLRSGQPRDSALWIHRLAVRCQRHEAAPERPAYAQRPKASAAEAAEAMLVAVPGIGPERARALEEVSGAARVVSGSHAS